MDLLGSIRRWSRAFAADRNLRMTNFESLAVAQVEPPGAEATRGNARFMLGNSAAITGIANVTALPTTAAQWALYNLEASGGKTAFLEELGMYLTSGTPGAGGILLACLFQLPAAVSSVNVTGCTISPAGKPVTGGASVSSGSNMVVKNSITISSPTAPNWFPVASNPSPNVTAFASSTFLEHRNLQGRIAIPPGYAMGLAVVAPAGTTPLFAPFAQWVELATDNE